MGRLPSGRSLQTVEWGVYRANPVPVLTSLSPSSATVGGAGFTLTVTGSHFVKGSQIRWNGAARATTFVSSGQLEAVIPASDIGATGTASVTVVNPAPVGGTSNALPFTIGPTMALDKTKLTFGAVTSGTAFLFKTSNQTVRLTQNGSGNVALDGDVESAVAAGHTGVGHRIGDAVDRPDVCEWTAVLGVADRRDHALSCGHGIDARTDCSS